MTGVRRSRTILSGLRIISTNTEIGVFLLTVVDRKSLFGPLNKRKSKNSMLDAKSYSSYFAKLNHPCNRINLSGSAFVAPPPHPILIMWRGWKQPNSRIIFEEVRNNLGNTVKFQKNWRYISTLLRKRYGLSKNKTRKSQRLAENVINWKFQRWDNFSGHTHQPNG